MLATTPDGCQQGILYACHIEIEEEIAHLTRWPIDCGLDGFARVTSV